MKIYVMCEPSKFSKLQKMQELHNSIVVTIGGRTTFLHILNTLIPVSPAVIDNLPNVIK